MNKTSNYNFDKNELKLIIFENEEKYNDYKKFCEVLNEVYPLSKSLKIYEYSRTEQFKFASEMIGKIIEKGLYPPINHLKNNEAIPPTLNFEYPGLVGNLMVYPLIDLLGNEEQKKYLPLLMSGYCFGVYAQTELGHGSDIQSLETEAIFKGDHFILNSPTISSKKWWPGELGYYGNIAIVFAKLIINNKSVGVYPFLIEIRDLNTHKVKEGIEIGDIGPKLGYNTKDNGYMSFNNLTIPKSSLLNKFLVLNENGEIKKDGNEKVIYASMMITRLAILTSSYNYLAKGALIALRYSNIRKQFRDSKNNEIPIIDYQLQKHKLYKQAANVFAMLFTYNSVKDYVIKTDKKIKEKNDFSTLKDAHIYVSGTKALFTQLTLDGLLICLQCCGGHGYSKLSGIPHLIEYTLPNTILEGENTILYLQVSRFLVKALKNSYKGKKLHGNTKFLNNKEELENFILEENINCLNYENLIKAFEKCCFKSIMKSGNILMKNELNDFKKTWDKKAGLSLFESAKIHTIYVSIYFFAKNIGKIKDNNLKLALSNLGLLYCIDNIINNCNLFLEFNIINHNHIEIFKNKYEELLDIISDDALNLLEGFEFSDNQLYSAISHSNAKPYENLYQFAKDFGQINQLNTDYFINNVRKSVINKYGEPKL